MPLPRPTHGERIVALRPSAAPIRMADAPDGGMPAP